MDYELMRGRTVLVTGATGFYWFPLNRNPN